MLDINQACEAFKILLEEQQARIANMSAEKVDFSTKACVTIGIVDGDGIGPLIMEHAVAVLKKLLAEEIKSVLSCPVGVEIISALNMVSVLRLKLAFIVVVIITPTERNMSIKILIDKNIKLNLVFLSI